MAALCAHRGVMLLSEVEGRAEDPYGRSPSAQIRHRRHFVLAGVISSGRLSWRRRRPVRAGRRLCPAAAPQAQDTSSFRQREQRLSEPRKLPDSVQFAERTRCRR